MEKIDYNKPITSEHIDWDSYHDKFKLVDEYKKTGNMEIFNQIMNDYTMFSYCFFKINNQAIKLYPYQDMILNDRHRYKIFRSARQLGKSLALDIKAARNLCVNHGFGHNECIISKSLPQAIFQMRRVKSLLNSARFDWTESKGSTDSMSVITVDIKDETGSVVYTNMLVVAPCTEGALGYDFHEVNLDETEWWDTDVRHFWNMIIEPTISATKGRITSFSNPNGSDTHVADLEKIFLKNGKKKYHTYVFSFMDRPGSTDEELDELRSVLTRQELESQYLAIRSLSDRTYFTIDEIERSEDKSLTELKMVGKQPFFFLDVGAKVDRSVLVGGYVEPDEHNDKLMHVYIPIIHKYPVGYPISMVVGSESEHNQGWQLEKSVKDYLLEWGKDGTNPIFGVDVTGNSGISPLFQSIDIYPQDVTFSGPVKSGMYQRFKYFMEKGLLHRIPDKDFEYEAKHLMMKKSVRGYLMVHHESEKDHDDVMDACSGLIHLADNPVIVPVSFKKI